MERSLKRGLSIRPVFIFIVIFLIVLFVGSYFGITGNATGRSDPGGEEGGDEGNEEQGGNGGGDDDFEEPPTEEPPTEPTVGDFVLSKNTLFVVLEQNEAETYSLNISNVGSLTLNLNIEVFDDEGFTSINITSLSLNPGDSKVVDIVVDISELVDTGSYTARIRFESSEVVKILNIYTTVLEEGAKNVIAPQEERPVFRAPTKDSLSWKKLILYILLSIVIATLFFLGNKEEDPKKEIT